MEPTTQTILFVDDESEILKALQRALRGEPYECLFAETGHQALKHLRELPISVLVSDLNMPQMDGMALLHQTKQEYPDVVRLVLSGRFDGDAIVQAVNSGQIHRYIIKPWDDGELKTILRNALQVHALHVEKRLLLARLEEHNRQLEQKVEQRTEELLKTRSQAEIGRYAAQIVHNLKNPLHAMGGALDLVEMMLKDETHDGNELLEVISLGRRSLNDLNKIVSVILDHARAHGEAHQERIDLNAVIRQEVIYFELDPLFHRKIKKEVNLAEGIPTILGSTTQIKQVLDNLIRNAIDAMAQSTEKKLKVKTESDGRWVFVEIGDTGEGISSEDLPRIFSGEFTTKSTGVGTGIGLSSVKRIVSSYGGQIAVDSIRGKGATFRISFPVKPENQNTLAVNAMRS
ncbi:MAG: ATP-binding protein [Desulfobacteraceae bacterium]|nr:ATP-binding protein [Desulfobacteraceae bacterium]